MDPFNFEGFTLLWKQNWVKGYMLNTKFREKWLTLRTKIPTTTGFTP